MNYALLRRTTTARQTTLEKELLEAKATVAASEKELHSIGQILAALKGTEGAAVPAGRGKGKSRRRKGGKWKKGHPGRPPKWYTEEMKAKGKKAAKATKPAKKTVRKKRTASPKMLAALAKARAARAAKRAGSIVASVTAPPS